MTTSSDDADLVARAKDGCATSMAALAARHQVAVVDSAVGVPAWADLAVFDPAAFAAADDLRP